MASGLRLSDDGAPRVHSARADYEPVDESELRMRLGDVLMVHGVRDGWSLASTLKRLAGVPSSGLVPSDYLNPATAASALADFVPAAINELQLTAGEEVWVLPALADTPDGWRQAVNDAGDQGLVPRSYLVATTSLYPTWVADTSPWPQQSLGMLTPSSSGIDRRPPPSEDKEPMIRVQPSYVHPADDRHLPGYSSVVLYDFEAQAPGEVSLRSGDQVRSVASVQDHKLSYLAFPPAK